MGTRVNHVLAMVAAGGVIAALNAAPALLDRVPAGPATDPAVAALGEDLDEILADPRLDGGQASVVVMDADTGETIYDHDGDTRLMPASNEKLFTSAAALDILGPEHTFDTTVLTDGRPAGSALRGDLYLRGTGDPTMLAADYADLAAQVARRGFTSVTGDIVADDTWFDDVRLGPDWAWDDEPYYYAAPVSALTVAPDTDYDAGTVIVEVSPGSVVGEAPMVAVVPATGAVTIANDATTTAAGSGRSIAVEREHGTDRIVVSGTIADDSSAAREWSSVEDPTLYAADVFRSALAAEGITVHGETVAGVTAARARPIAEHSSMPLSAIMTPFMKLSNNGHAEVLMKSIGREVSGEGSWSAGIDAFRGQLEAYGVDIATVANRDGSGLSRRNLVPAAEIATLLEIVQDKPWFEVWHESLPIAGVSERMVGGTLRSRMTGTAAANNVHAKTGSLTGASALSGYVTDADGNRLIFAIVLNDYLSGKPSDLEDRIAVRLAAHSTDGDVAAQRRASADVPAVDLPDDVECSWVKAC